VEQVENEESIQFVPAGLALDVDDMLALLVQAGYSNTRARRAVLQAISEAAGQGSPADLLAEGRRYHHGLGLVTVYRTLDILSSLGVIKKLHTDGGCHTYAVAGHNHSHHLICKRCQRVLEFEGCDIDRVVEAVERQTGFKVSGHWLEVFGVCPECQTALDAALGAED